MTTDSIRTTDFISISIRTLDALTEEAGNFGPGVPVVAHQRRSAP